MDAMFAITKANHLPGADSRQHHRVAAGLPILTPHVAASL
jgi:hypothetical protein